MLGLLFISLLFPAALIAGLTRPAFGMIFFYAFVLLDPIWNWRWAIPQDVRFQQWIFVASLIGFLLQGVRIPKMNKASKWGLLAGAAFLIVCHISASISILPGHSEQFISIFNKEMLCIFLTVFLLDSPHKIKLFLIAATISQGYNAYQINLDYFQTGFSRWAYSNWGSYGTDNNGYSLITLPMLGISLGFAFGETIRWRKYVFLIVAILQIHQVYLSFSRGAMLAMVVMLPILLWKMPRSKINYQIIAIGLLASFMLAGPSVVKEFSSVFASKEDRDSSAESRFDLWKAGFRITMDYPLNGVGPDAARKLVPQARYYDGGLTTKNKALHNLFFDVSTGTGIPGLVLYISFILIPIFSAWRNYDPEDNDFSAIYLSIICGSIAYLVGSMFSSGVLFESAYILLIAGYATMIVKHKRKILNTLA